MRRWASYRRLETAIETVRADVHININIQKRLWDLSQLSPVIAEINFNLLLSQIEF